MTILVRAVLQKYFFVSTTFAEDYIGCHKQITAGIVLEWKLSKQSKKGIGCTHSHGDKHVSKKDFEKVRIPSPDGCTLCHEKQFKQFIGGKHSLAW